MSEAFHSTPEASAPPSSANGAADKDLTELLANATHAVRSLLGSFTSQGRRPGVPRRSGRSKVRHGKRWLVALGFLFLLLSVAPLRAIDATASTVDPGELAAFMNKWKAAEDDAMTVPVAPKERKFIIPAIVKDPAGPWTHLLQLELAVARFEIRKAPAAQRRELAAAALRRVREANSAIAQALEGKRDEALQEARAALQPLTFFWSIEAGDIPAGMRAEAEELLAAAGKKKDWNQGNVIFSANQTLGRIALKEGRIQDARRHLRAAGKTPGSPQLDSFGPEFVLARELLEHGATEDRETVLAFLKDVERFWADPGLQQDDLSRRLAADHLKELQGWQEEIRDGNIPRGGKWR
jgi:hypothetical protein